MPVPVYVALEQIDGSVSHYGVVPYSISNGGMGFLHGSFVHKDTRCALQLTALDGRTVAVSGVTTHATCLRGFVHFVGVKFDESINALDFVELDREDAEHYARNPKLCSKLAEDLNGLVVTNATISEMRAKYCELGQALFGQDASKRDKR